MLLRRQLLEKRYISIYSNNTISRAEAEAEETDDPNIVEVLPRRVIEKKIRIVLCVLLLATNKIRKHTSFKRSAMF
jgi:hypothetical protein